MKKNLYTNRPKSESELKLILSRAYEYAQKSDYEKALYICNWLIQDKSTEIAGYRKRAAIREHMGDMQEAISDLKHVISVCKEEPADYYGLGLLQLIQGFTEEAIDSFSKTIDLCKITNNDYYKFGSYFFRAEAYLRNNDLDMAISDCMELPAAYGTYLSGVGMRSREDILEEARSRICKKGKRKK